MYPLFWKIFLTYWLTILIIELFTAWISADLSEYEIHPILERQNEKFVTSSTVAVTVLTEEGLSGLQAWLRNAKNHEAIDDIFVFNKHYEEINNKPLPNNVTAILRNTVNDITYVDHYQPLKNTLSFKTVSPEGDDYLLISTFEHPHPIKYLLAPHRVALGIIISGIICLLLARYFTSPLTKLRNSTQLLALGEFKTVGLKQFKNRTDEFGALAGDFETMTNRLRDLMESQKQLLRDISHELRSPLARIQVALDLARKKFNPTESNEFDRIEQEIEQLDSLISELLTFVRIDANINLDRKQLDLHELISSIVDDINYENQEKQTQFELDIELLNTIHIEGDPLLVHRSLENIIRNAHYYSPPNTVIHIRTKTISNDVHIEIEDSGPGVPEYMLGKIFEPFVRVSSARETDTGGSGIGLAIAKRIIETHSGTIAASNKTNGAGLIVTITLPINFD